MEKDDISYEYYNWGPLVCKYETPLEAAKKITALGRKRSNRDLRKDLAGHIENEYGFTNEDRDVFLKWYGKYFDAYSEAYRGRYGTNYNGLNLTSLWINFMQAGDFNPPHYHTQHVSFVLFTSDNTALQKEIDKFKGTGPAPGQLIFDYGSESYKYAPEWNIRSHYVTPKAGDLFIFPALLKHWVCPFKTDMERVSLSGNLKFKDMPSDPF